MSYEWLAMLMFVGFFGLLLTGYPVAFSFAATAIVFGLIGLGLDAFDARLLNALPSRWYGTMTDITLLAIPFFVFLGAILERSGLAEDLLETAGILLGPVRGGMALAVVLVGTLLAATTGVVAASVIAMGLITLPIMLRYGYNKGLATGVIASSGTLAQMIPPSLVLVVLSDQVGVSVGDLFAGALTPGLMLASFYGIYCVGIAYLRPGYAPALPPEARTIRGRALALRVVKALLPPLVLIALVLGSIFGGYATPTEAGAVGALGATILAALNRRLSWESLRAAADTTVRTTALVIVILFCSTFFSLVFEGLGGSTLVRELLTNLPGGVITFIIVANIVVFLLGIPLEFIEISFIVFPLFVPAARELGIDLVWFAVVMSINLQTAFVSPPVGFSLFYLSSVLPKGVTTLDVNKGVLPFIVIQLIVLILVIVFPDLVTWLVRAANPTG
jgi:tripartite ATP-independent transporter DctM subunit